jgi:hypothetical protein
VLVQVASHETALDKVARAGGVKPALWVVSRGAFAGEVAPNQSTLFGFTRVLQAELTCMVRPSLSAVTHRRFEPKGFH